MQLSLKLAQHGKPAPQRLLFMAATGGVGRQPGSQQNLLVAVDTALQALVGQMKAGGEFHEAIPLLG